MGKKRRRKKKFRWWTERTSSAYEVRSRLLTKAKRWILELMSRRETAKPVRRRRRRKREPQAQSPSLQKIWQNVFLQFKPECRRRRKKRPLTKRIRRSCLQLAISLQQQITKLFTPQKRRKRRKRRKQYAVYVMANQKKVD